MKKVRTTAPFANGNKERLRRRIEAISTVGLLLIAAGLMAPFAAVEDALIAGICKWVFAAGAVIYTVARMVNVNDPGDSLKLRRLRRMEMWAGFCFVVASGFWFYNAHRLAGIVFSLPVMNNTIVFTLAGAMIQVISSWMISARAKKEKGLD
ncbi:MAG: hypothetical protein OSJ32_01980 [Muribaculaceae bacterium]|jgi:hypothetical protein|uniref:hypothetical protein n=1 Tax=Barnesiella sp. CU968 TaxID=2780099 RepID=UPI000E9304CA|nr:hypothetical protein [Barnesiella sp. CU968]MBJ2192631.1 hypothetical protein [Muribaculaceae bacterium]ROS85892.1 hypothetical protein EEK90_01845 [Muribaculaceae bacterium Isolate-036 (Harlan)]ROT20793.1 hypothetical protein EEL53_08045 [Muribaculaceae bacterium Isolate-114 (HZI)]HBY16098.1 hypothetical protein [Porphyromonadaceae bacterium]MBJ2197258.1 hypothetical protein [Muribaculaceae bacterium]